MAKPDSEDAARGPVPDWGAPVVLPPWLKQGSWKGRRPGEPRIGWPLSVRVRVRLQRFSLDRQLARGADPRSSSALARRAHELCQLKLRRGLATDIERAIEAANVPARQLTAAVPVDRRAISECRHLLLGLAEDLRCAGCVYARGVALVRVLLSDGGSPLYARSEPRELEEAIRRARAALMAD